MPLWGSSSSASDPAGGERQAAAEPSAAAPAAPAVASDGSGSGAASAAAAPAAAPPAAEEKENPWEVNKPVERRTQALNEEAHDCLYCFWSWITCGGPGARMRQLYVNGKLSRCMDDYTRLRNCLVMKMDPEKEIKVIPGPHPVWHIRTRKQAAEFWQENYKHLREGIPRPGDGVRGGADPDSGMLATPLDITATSSGSSRDGCSSVGSGSGDRAAGGSEGAAGEQAAAAAGKEAACQAGTRREVVRSADCSQSILHE